MKFFCSILFFIYFSAQAQFTFVSKKNYSYKGDVLETVIFNLKYGRRSDTLRMNEKIIVGAITAHGIMGTDSGEQFYISFSPLLDTSRIPITSNVDTTELYSLYMDKKELKILKILYTSWKSPMVWYYKK